MDKERNYKALKEFCEHEGVDLFGVADISKVREEFLLAKDISARFDNAICLGARLSQVVLEEIKDFPTRLYSYHYRMVNMFLDQLAYKACRFIERKGFLALAIPTSQVLDWQKQTSHISHKKIANLAGLGWVGRNNLLVTEEFGAQVRLVTILTNMPLKCDKPNTGMCGECLLCVNACPAQAIKEKSEDFDHLKCFEKLKEFNRRRMVEQYICGVCVNVCKGKR